MKTLIAVTISIFLLISCESAPPEVEDLNWQIEVTQRPDTQAYSVYLHVTAQIREPQGFGDIREIRIEAPDRMYWDVSPEEISYRQEGELITFHSGRLGPEREHAEFPAGTYRLSVTDIPGNRDEKEFFLSRGSDAFIQTEHIPRLIEQEEGTAAESSAGECEILFFDRRGSLISRSTADGPIEDQISDEYSFYYILAEGEDQVIYTLGPVYR